MVKFRILLWFIIVILFMHSRCTKNENPMLSVKNNLPPAIRTIRTYGSKGSDFITSIHPTLDKGYILSGSSDSYNKGMIQVWLILVDSTGNERWMKTYGGNTLALAKEATPTVDGGYIVTGGIQSNTNLYDILLLKIDAMGNQMWLKQFGLSGDDIGNAVSQINDGGFIIAGRLDTRSADSWDCWLIKTDVNGNQQWEKRYGGVESQEACEVQQTYDNGFILVGRNTKNLNGATDGLLIKTDMNGNQLWKKNFIGTGFDWLNSVRQTSDSGYIAVGYTNSFGAGDFDFWLLKTDKAGNQIWMKTYGGTKDDRAYSVYETNDGGFIITGCSSSFGETNGDVWIVKTDASGEFMWDIRYGVKSLDEAWSVLQTSSGGYVIAGCQGTDGLFIKLDYYKCNQPAIRRTK